VTDDCFVQFIDSLKVNTTLTELDFSRTLKIISCVFVMNNLLFSFVDFEIFMFQLFFDSDNKLGDDGAKYVADVLKLNRTLNSIRIHCEDFIFIFF